MNIAEFDEFQNWEKYEAEKNYDDYLKRGLAEFFEGKLWKGPDVAAAANLMVQPGDTEFVPIRIPYDQLPFLKKNSVQSLDFVKVSVRSRFAQMGLEIGGARGMVYHSHKDETGRIGAFNGTRPEVAYVFAKNHTARPLLIPQDEQVFRYYHNDESLAYNRSEVLQLLRDGNIHVEGEPGRDYMLTTGGLALRVQEDNRFIIPASIDPMDPRTLGKDFRKDIESQYMKQAPKTTFSIFFVGQTSHLTLSDQVEAELDFNTYHYNQRLQPVYGYHINSRFIDAGSDHPIKVEILGPTIDQNIWAAFRFYKKNKLVLPGNNEFVIPSHSR